MTSFEALTRSSRKAILADEANIRGRRGQAIELYTEAADMLEETLPTVPENHRHTRWLIQHNLSALRYKAAQLSNGE